MKLISLSVYGSNAMYVRGAIENAKLWGTIYPGWAMRVYHSPEVPRQELEKLGVQLVLASSSKGHSGMLWRFLPAWEEGVERVIFRDADSRFNVREAAAVRAWEESGLDAHCMHDHEHHRGLPLFGGMWGVKGGVLNRESFQRMYKACQKNLERVGDMYFLQRFVLPQIQGSLLRHSSYPVKWPGAQSFPHHPPYKGFVGQQFNADGTPVRVMI